MILSLEDLRSEAGGDQTLQNLLHALTLNLELRDRYRVYEHEARQDGLEACAALFASLRRAESNQIADLLAGLRKRLGEIDPAHSEGVA